MEKIKIKDWKIYINFLKDSFWPYEQKFGREDCYYDDKLQDRWSVIFPFKNKQFDNTEIFLETDDIIVWTWERTNLSWTEKNFIDIINLKTEKKQRLFVEEVNLIYNWEQEIVINWKINWIWKTVKLDQETMEIKEEKEEKLLAFFKVLYNENEDNWYKLKYNENNFYDLIIESKIHIKPELFDRKKFLLRNFDLWGESNFYEQWKDFINNQNYILGKTEKKKF